MRGSGVRRRVGSWRSLLRGMVIAGSIASLAATLASQSIAEDPAQPTSKKPAPTPFIEREEVRFVTLDLVVERHGAPGGSGWHLARGLTKDQVHLLLGSKEVPLDLFEDWCPMTPPRETSGALASSASVPESSNPRPEGSPRGEQAQRELSAHPRSLKFILYFDLEHLTSGARNMSYRSAIDWAAKEVKPGDVVMIVTGGLNLRIVRPLLPAGGDLQADIRRAMEDFTSEDRWADGEHRRSDEIIAMARMERPYPPHAAQAMANGYANVDHDYTRRSLENLKDLMTLFDKVEGTKNLVFFGETVRFVPGSEYPLATQLTDVSTQLENLARAANERNVRIYGVQAAGLGEDIEDTMTMLSTETGGQHLENTNRIGPIFDRALEDSSCFYRLGFRVPSLHSGKTERINVKIGTEEGRYRLRYRRDLADPTREQAEEDSIRAALLSPESAKSFPVSVSAYRLYDHPTGSRFRIEVSVPLEALLARPGPPEEGRRMSLLLGGRVVPLLPAATGNSVAGIEHAASTWMNVDPRRASWGFDRKAEIRVPVSAAHDLVSRAVYRNEIDVPPGDYRIVSVVEDGLTRALSTALTDFTARASTSLLGHPVLGVEDPTVLLVQAAAPEAASPKPEKGAAKDIVSIDPSVPFSQSVALEGDSIPMGSIVSYTPICPTAAPTKKKAADSTEPDGGSPWRIRRMLGCVSSNQALSPLLVPSGPTASGCLMIAAPVVSEILQPGRCTLQVSLERPGLPAAETTLEFSMAAPPGPDPDSP